MNIQSHVEALKVRLSECPATREEIAAATGLLSASWVSKFASGRMRNPRVDSLVALDTALSHFERREAA
jgi:transcriptional regulator with XRE-family HTH domain